MPCLSSDGTLTRSVRTLLEMCQHARRPEEISAKLEEPLFKVRSGLREMVNVGLVKEEAGRHQITESGREALGLE